MTDNHVYDPLKSYKNVLKDKHHENTTKYFKELVKKSNIDVEANKETVKLLKTLEKDYSNINKAISKYRALNVVIVIVSVILLLIGVGSLFNPDFELKIKPILIVVAEITAAISLLVLMFVKINPHITVLKSNTNELKDKINKLKKEAIKQMAPLNKLFNEHMSLNLFKETLPLLNFDNYFNNKRLEYLNKKFGLSTVPNLNRSTLFVKSGDLNGNPFYIANDLVHQLGVKTYTGSKTIHWTTYSTVNGKRVAQRRSQVLTASINKPYPYYNEQSYLVYGNEAAPNLIFDRTDSDAEIMNEKQITRHVKRETKKLRRKERKHTKGGNTFTRMSHDEFEVLFGATNRNNEVEFRLLFTPLAQKQLLELMKDKEIAFGDNFDFSKHKKINIIYPEHLNAIDLEKDPNYFKTYDYKETKLRFISYNDLYFKSIYFSFAPILAIPLYQQQKPHEYIYKDLYPSLVSFYEHEKLVNKMGVNKFSHPESKTRTILKTNHIKTLENKDQIKVTAYSYKSKPRIDFATRMGGDGRVHSIPIHWNEFTPITKDSLVDINVIPDEKDLNYQDHVRNFINKLQNKEKLEEKDLQRIGRFIAYLHKD